MNWLNILICRRFDIRRIDVLIFILGSGIAVHYWVYYGWQWAILGVLLYIFVLMIVVWLI